MEQNNLNDLLENLSKAIEATTAQAEPNVRSFIQAARPLINELQANEKNFQEMQTRVERKLRSGIRRTKGNPV